MMYYNMWGTPITRPTQKSEVKPVQYAFKDEVDYLKRIVDKHDVDIDHCLQVTEVNRKDCEQMYQAIDMLKHDVQYVKSVANYLYDSRAESAPSVAKRKRRVTICAGGQTIEVCR